MRKTDKKLDREIIRELTQMCEAAKFDHEGFIWLTHEVNYQRFPQSLKVTLVFNESVSEEVLLAEFQALIPNVQLALEPVIGEPCLRRKLKPAGNIDCNKQLPALTIYPVVVPALTYCATTDIKFRKLTGENTCLNIKR